MRKKVVLITGSNSKLGSFVVNAFLEKGYIIYAGVRSKNEVPQPSVNNIRYVSLDVTSEADWRKSLKQIYDEHKAIDVVVNNAGVTISKPILDTSTEEFTSLFSVNALSSVHLLKVLNKTIQNQKTDCKVICITSISGIISFPNFAAYSASKFALESILDTARYELKNGRLKVVTLEPGAIKFPTEGPRLSHKTARDKFPILNILLPMAKAEDVANQIVDISNRTTVSEHVLIGTDAKILYLAEKFLPRSIWSKLVKKL